MFENIGNGPGRGAEQRLREDRSRSISLFLSLVRSLTHEFRCSLTLSLSLSLFISLSPSHLRSSDSASHARSSEREGERITRKITSVSSRHASRFPNRLVRASSQIVHHRSLMGSQIRHYALSGNATSGYSRPIDGHKLTECCRSAARSSFRLDVGKFNRRNYPSTRSKTQRERGGKRFLFHITD